MKKSIVTLTILLTACGAQQQIKTDRSSTIVSIPSTANLESLAIDMVKVSPARQLEIYCKDAQETCAHGGDAPTAEQRQLCYLKRTRYKHLRIVRTLSTVFVLSQSVRLRLLSGNGLC